MTEHLQAELLFRGSLVLDAPQPVGNSPHGNRQIIRVVSGTLEGPKIKGETLAMSGDWLLLRPDGVGELDVRSTIRTDDGEFIYMNYKGLMHGTPETMQRMFAGEPIKPEDLYFRTAPFFETGSEKYAWINRILTVCYGVVALPKLDITVYTIL